MGNGTALGRVRGLGSAKEGAHHWWHQRLTAGAQPAPDAVVHARARAAAGAMTTARVHAGSPSAWVAVPLILLIVSVF